MQKQPKNHCPTCATSHKYASAPLPNRKNKQTCYELLFSCFKVVVLYRSQYPPLYQQPLSQSSRHATISCGTTRFCRKSRHLSLQTHHFYNYFFVVNHILAITLHHKTKTTKVYQHLFHTLIVNSFTPLISLNNHTTRGVVYNRSCLLNTFRLWSGMKHIFTSSPANDRSCDEKTKRHSLAAALLGVFCEVFRRLLADAKLLLRDDCAITLNIGANQIIEQATTLTYQHLQGTLGRIILLVDLQMLGQVGNTNRE